MQVRVAVIYPVFEVAARKEKKYVIWKSNFSQHPCAIPAAMAKSEDVPVFTFACRLKIPRRFKLIRHPPPRRASRGKRKIFITPLVLALLATRVSFRVRCNAIH